MSRATKATIHFCYPDCELAEMSLRAKSKAEARRRVKSEIEGLRDCGLEVLWTFYRDDVDYSAHLKRFK